MFLIIIQGVLKQEKKKKKLIVCARTYVRMACDSFRWMMQRKKQYTRTSLAHITLYTFHPPDYQKEFFLLGINTYMSSTHMQSARAKLAIVNLSVSVYVHTYLV